MKKPILSILFAIGVVLQLSANYTHTNNRNVHQDTVSYLEISGRIYDLAGDDGLFRVEFVKAGFVVDSVTVSGNQEFRFLIKKGEHHAIRISKNNVIMRQIFLRTKNPAKDHASNHFHFHTDLSFDRDENDSGFPVAVVSLRSFLPDNQSAMVFDQIRTGQVAVK